MSDGPKASAVEIREARREDCKSLVEMSIEIANYHSHFNSAQVTPEQLEKDTFDVQNPNMGFYVAEVDKAVVAYGHYIYTYTIRNGKAMILQDLYVKEKYRGRLIGEKILQAICKEAIQNGVTKMEFVVTDWNPAKEFYKRKGAVNVTETDNFHFYKFNKKAISEIASKSL